MADEKEAVGRFEIYVVGYAGNGKLGDIESKKLTKWLSHSDAKAQSIHLGKLHSIIRDGDGQNAFGWNKYGQCGVCSNDERIRGTPIKFFSNSGIPLSTVFCSSTSSSTFWQNINGDVFGAGMNNEGQLGIGNTKNQTTPTLIKGIRDVKDIQSGDRHSLALAKSARVFYCGSNNYGQCGGGSGSTEWQPIRHFANIKVIAIAAGDKHSVFLDDSNAVWMCGDNKYGQIGLGKETDQSEDKTRPPTKVAFFIQNNIRIARIASGFQHTLALGTNGTVFAWGRNWYGQCGQNPQQKENVLSPEAVPSLKGRKCKEIKCGYYHCYVQTEDGQHLLFGRNRHNEVTLFADRNFQVYEATPIKCFFRIIEVYLGCLCTCFKYTWTSRWMELYRSIYIEVCAVCVLSVRR